MDCYNPIMGPGLSNYYFVGGNATGASTATATGGGGGFHLAFAGLTLPETLEILDTANDVVDGFGSLSNAAKYGIQGYSNLRYDIKNTGLEAHHIVEQRFLKGKNINVQTAASVALTPQEHRRFTNNWRTRFPYGKQNYHTLPKSEIWEAAQDIYHGYPALLDAAWDVIKLMD